MRCKPRCLHPAGIHVWLVHYALPPVAVRTGHGRPDQTLRAVRRGGRRQTKPVTAQTIRRKREKPFAAEYALLAELRLRRN